MSVICSTVLPASALLQDPPLVFKPLVYSTIHTPLLFKRCVYISIYPTEYISIICIFHAINWLYIYVPLVVG